MSRNWIQFQKGYSLTQFVEEYGAEDQCAKAFRLILVLEQAVSCGLSHVRGTDFRQSRAVPGYAGVPPAPGGPKRS